jgi:hypothetical protein
MADVANSRHFVERFIEVVFAVKYELCKRVSVFDCAIKSIGSCIVLL